VPAGDVAALAREIVRYLRDPARCAAEGRAGRAAVERRFDGRRQAKRIQNEIVEACASREAT
jgi:glycosyltransferase involved in cell wall biosynthesis